VLSDNPLADFVELPEELRGLHYSNLLAGVVRGALEQVGAGRRGGGRGGGVLRSGRRGRARACRSELRQPWKSGYCAAGVPWHALAAARRAAGTRLSHSHEARLLSSSPGHGLRGLDRAPLLLLMPWRVWACGAAQVNMEVECRWVGDMLRGDEAYELRLKLKEHRDERFPFKDDD
jgi:hypothetical protein